MKKNPNNIQHAKSLRQNMTDVENRLWFFLRNRRLNGYKFVRQCMIGNYIVDFVCREKLLIIELDGSQHMDATHYDTQRTNCLALEGYEVLRFWNNDVFNQQQDVLEKILSVLTLK